MEKFDIYKDIATRTDGDVYIGVVGPVRSGKSAFVKKLTERFIIPNIASKNKQKIALDETPQSAGGKTVMTTEPKFVPSEAVSVKIDKAQANVRLIDCVGYMVEGAFFGDEEGKPRLVKTPWSDKEMPFDKAAETGTEKVIKDHSTIGVVVTCDGSFTGIQRSAYAAAEDRVIKELKSIDKPFIVVFNCSDPLSEAAKREAAAIEKKHGVTVEAVNIENLTDGDIERILSGVLKEFPVSVVNVDLPKWMRALPEDNAVVKDLLERIATAAKGVEKMKDVDCVASAFSGSDDYEEDVSVEEDSAKGVATVAVRAKSGLFYKVLSDQAGETLTDEFSVMDYVKNLAVAKREYARLKDALDGAAQSGYGVALPTEDERALGEAEVVKRGGGYCVKMRAEGKALHIIKTDVRSDVKLINGTKEQCDALAGSINSDDGEKLGTLIFGKPVGAIVESEIDAKCLSLAAPVRERIRRTLSKAVNEKKSNVFCILV